MANPLRAALKGFLTGEIAPSGRIIAYHGSPYTFDRFDFSKMGTGEGAQAYGWGGYFAERPQTATSYRDALTGAVYLDGVNIDKVQMSAPVWTALSGHRGDYDKALAHLIRRDEPLFTKELESLKGRITTDKGRLYEVDLPEGPYLDWDKPLGEQGEIGEMIYGSHERARKDILSAIPEIDGGVSYDDYMRQYGRALDEAAALPRRPTRANGSDVYSSLASERADASDALSRAGLKGIRYLDQGSRSKGDGTSNYVIFNDKDVNIRKMLGLVLAAGGAGALREALREQSVSA